MKPYRKISVPDNEMLKAVKEACGLKEGGKLTVSGLKGSSASFFVSLLFSQIKKTIVTVVPKAEAERLYDDISFFSCNEIAPYFNMSCDDSEANILFFPPVEVLPYEDVQPYKEILFKRIETLYRLGSEDKGLVLVTTCEALMQKVMSRENLLSSSRLLKEKHILDREEFKGNLLYKGGYKQVDMVEERGDIALRGGIMDIFPPLYESPVRMEFLGEEIDSIRTFDIDSQRSLSRLSQALILPACLSSETSSTLMDYLPSDAVFCIKDPAFLRQDAKRFRLEAEDRFKQAKDKGALRNPRRCFLSDGDLMKSLRRFSVIYLEFLKPTEHSGRVFPLRVESNEDIRRDILSQKGDFLLKPLAERIDKWREEGWNINFIVRTSGQKERLRDILSEYGISFSESAGRGVRKDFNPSILIGHLSEGFLMPSSGLVLITEEEIFGHKLKRRPPVGRKKGELLSSLSEIDTGDLVVHTFHGIGIYRGLVRLSVEEEESDYLCVEYAGGDKLYLPAYKLALLQKYIGGEGASPPVDKLGGITWARVKRRAKKAAQKVAQELLATYAARKALKGFAFSSGGRLFQEFEASFEYEETPDQKRAIDEVLQDMESERPMDRLVCGDVGYGKTEVALRASFKTVLDNKQAAFLVPTTILAQQHYETFKYRFAPYPVNVEVLSRFKTHREQKEIIKRLAEGGVDILIGTHRMLQDDVVFKDIGLVIIDEEQRFGVAHKEKLRRLKKLVDVLTLTATPIPRTLQISVAGVRDMSIISTPPEDRLSIQTFISHFDKGVIREAIHREISRGGQVFFVHNRIKSVEEMARLIRDLVPDTRVGVAHGRMKETQLEDVMWDFFNKRHDVLVTTSIIESGLDIPTANTIIINMADRFGLAQLYQLRGRVGRSHHRAYAYLLIPEGSRLTDEGRKRLKAIEELSELGSGFTLAVKDMEIRGAGEFLGTAQSGNVEMVGLNMYTRLLEEAVKELKGEEIEEEIDTEIKVPLPCYFPKTYIISDKQRLFFYRRLASAGSLEYLDMIKDELRDRFGEIPRQGINLIGMMGLKILGRRLGVKEIDIGKNRVSIAFCDLNNKNTLPRVSPESIIEFVGKNRENASFTPDQRLIIRFNGKVIDPVSETRKVLLCFINA